MNQSQPKKLTTSLEQAIGSHFFNQIQRAQQQNMSRSQIETQEQLQEVEDIFDEQFELDDSGNQSMLHVLKRKASRSLRPSVYMHNTIAMCLNVFTVLTATPFKLFPRSAFILFFVISIFCTYRFLYNYKSYSIFEFEDLYSYLKKKSQLQYNQLQVKKQNNPHEYYSSLIRYLSQHFPGVHFEYKLQKRIADSQAYLDRSRERSVIIKALKRLYKNLTRSLMFWQYPSAGDKFVKASESVYLKFVKAEYWQNEESRWIYFMYLNLPIVVTCYFGGFQVIFIDLLFLLFASQITELMRAQSNGDKLLHETLQYIEKRAEHNVQQQKLQNGKIIEQYIKLKQRQSMTQSQQVAPGSLNQSRINATVNQSRVGNDSIRQSIAMLQQRAAEMQRGSVPSNEFEAKKFR